MVFGPGTITPAVRAIIFANIGLFLITFFAADVMIDWFALVPSDVVSHGQVWRLGTYLFLHDPRSLMHILFNMLAVWMFGVDLERRWGTRGFVIYYFVTGVGAGLSMILVSLLPFAATRATYLVPTIGASGAVYGLLMAWAIVFPTRTILFMLMFPLTARVYALVMGAIAFFAAIGASGGPVANVAHLGGLVFGWLYLRGPRDMRVEMRYQWTKWRMARLRRKFDVHKGGRGGGDDWQDRIH